MSTKTNSKYGRFLKPKMFGEDFSQETCRPRRSRMAKPTQIAGNEIVINSNSGSIPTYVKINVDTAPLISQSEDNNENQCSSSSVIPDPKIDLSQIAKTPDNDEIHMLKRTETLNSLDSIASSVSSNEADLQNSKKSRNISARLSEQRKILQSVKFSPSGKLRKVLKTVGSSRKSSPEIQAAKPYSLRPIKKHGRRFFQSPTLPESRKQSCSMRQYAQKKKQKLLRLSEFSQNVDKIILNISQHKDDNLDKSILRVSQTSQRNENLDNSIMRVAQNVQSGDNLDKTIQRVSLSKDNLEESILRVSQSNYKIKDKNKTITKKSRRPSTIKVMAKQKSSTFTVPPVPAKFECNVCKKIILASEFDSHKECYPMTSSGPGAVGIISGNRWELVFGEIGQSFKKGKKYGNAKSKQMSIFASGSTCKARVCTGPLIIPPNTTWTILKYSKNN